MKNPESSVFVGYVEQAVAGRQDPLSPPISISRNGSLAKWRGKFHFLDLRVNDPGLKKHREDFRQMLQKAQTLGLETIVTLPQFNPVLFDLPPEDPEKIVASNRKTQQNRPEKLVYFKPAFLALHQAVRGSSSFTKLAVADCQPIIELAAEFGVNKIVVPVSEPGQYLDRVAEDEFEKCFAELDQSAKSHGIRLHVRNGGLSERYYKRLRSAFGCGLAYNVGIAHLESDNIFENYCKWKNDIAILMLHQVLPGIDRWEARRTALEKSLKNYVAIKKEYRQSLEDGDNEYAEKCLKRFNAALKDYYEAFKNLDSNLGLFQNGDLNLVPLLKEIRNDIADGQDKYLLLETVPNTRNSDFVFRYLLADSFSGSF